MTVRGDLARLMPDSILDRLRLLLFAVFALGGLVAMGAAWLFSATAATDAYDRLLMSAASQIGEAIDVEDGRITALPPDSAFETLAQSAGDRFFFAVRSPDGALLTGHAALRPAAVTASDEEAIFDSRSFAGATMRTVTIRRLIVSPSARGWCSIVVAQTLGARHRLMMRLMLKIGAIILFVGTLGLFASISAVRRALAPFDRISRALADRRTQDTAPLHVDSPPETRALIDTINSAFVRLHDRMSKLERLTSVAAHQIRTPLAALGAQTELLLADKTAGARRLRVDRLRKHIAALSRLTHQLLGQAMVSYRSERVQHARVDMVALVPQTLRDTVPESLERDLSIDVEPTSMAIHIVGDRVSLREAVSNLVSNAVTHGARSRIRVRIFVDGGNAVVSVADDGPGIEPARWESVVQPFHAPRGDGEGAGLGIAIVADVARAHGGALTFGYAEDGLFQATLAIPLAPDEARQ